MRREVSARGETTDRRGISAAARRMAQVFACLVLAGAARDASAQVGDSPVRRYSNPEYEYVVRLPGGLPIERSSGPGPNHGLNVQLAPGSSAWVFSHYETENIYTLSSEVENVVQLRREAGCTATERKAATLGGVPAAELTFQCAPESGRGQPNTLTLLLTLQRPPDRGYVVYQVGTAYPKGSEKAAEAERVYRALADGFAFTWPAAARSE